MSKIRLSQRGFTLVELMIAISVLATILLLVAIGIIQISKSYYKGITQSNTQQAARTILDTVTQTLQFGDYTSIASANATYAGPFTTQSYCIATERFNSVLKYQKQEGVASSQSAGNIRHALWQDNVTAGPCTAIDLSVASPMPSSNGHELLGDHMRLTKFEILGPNTLGPAACAGDVYCVSVSVMYGDDDLIDESNFDMSKWTCKPSQGVFAAAFCAKADLTSVVQKRL